MEFTDLHGETLKIGTKAKLSGGYDDPGRPIYLMHELVEVVGFSRKKVKVKLLSRDYADRAPLSLYPRTLVIERS